MNAEARRWISVRECSEFLGISVKGCYALAARNALPVVRVGGRTLRIDRKALEQGFEKQLAAAAGK